MKEEKGFTLVEVLAIIAVLGVMVILTFPSIGGSNDTKKEKELEKLIGIIENSAKAYFSFNSDEYKVNLNTLIEEEYIVSNMTNPKTNEKLEGCVRKVLDKDNIYTYIYGDCESITVDISFVLGDRTIKETHKDGEQIELEKPTREGQTFKGWVIVKGNSVLKGNTLIVGTTETIIYALWEIASTLTVDLDGGSVSKSDNGIYSSGTIIELKEPTKTGYTFTGWEKVSGNGVLSGNTFTMGTGNTIVKATWEGNKYIVTLDANGGEFSQALFTDPKEHEYIVQETSEYQLEVWGAQGGSNGGYGGYSKGVTHLEKGTKLYINIGGKGSRNAGGYNGGGNGQQIAGTANPAGYGGGGASHISKESGLLKNIKIENVYIIAGGGGGMGENGTIGGHAGGYIGNNGTGTCYIATGGTQLAGGTRGDSDATNGGYGYGGNAPSGSTTSGTYGAGGGGSGYYGGGGNSFKSGSNCAGGGAGGSGYIGNSLLTNKAMYCYNCEESEEESTKTISTTAVDDRAIANYAKKDGGAARISIIKKEKDVIYSLTYDNLPIPTREGYTFLGWYTEIDGGIKITNDTQYNFTENKTLYAGWLKSEYAYTGNYELFIVPYSGYYKIELWGAEGGADSTYKTGMGAYTSGVIKLIQNEKLYIYVGGQGADKDTTAIGGYNGGGNSTKVGTGKSGITGGGATDIRYFNEMPDENSLVWNSTLGLNSRLMVAGGGGGGGSDNPGFSNSGLLGEDGYPKSYEYYAYIGKGAGQIVSGAAPTKFSTATSNGTAGGFGFGGTGGGSYSGASTGGGAGGGGGYYGGSGSSGLSNGTWAAGGGSSFISGYAGVNAITSSIDRTHTNNTLHYSNKYFIDGEIETGVNTDNGKAKITYLGTSYEKKNTKLNNVRYIKDCINGNSYDVYNHWVELQAIKDGINVAKGKKVSATSSEYNTSGNYSFTYIVDGKIDNTSGSSGYGATSGTGLQCVTIDLDGTYDLDEIAIWHYFESGLSYNNHSLYVSSDNTNWTTLINNVSGVIETANGIRVSAYD